MDKSVIELGELLHGWLDDRVIYKVATELVNELTRYKEWYVVEDWIDLNALWLFASNGEWADYDKDFKVSFPARIQAQFFWEGEMPIAQLKVLNPGKLDLFKLKLGLLQKRFRGQSVSWKSERV